MLVLALLASPGALAEGPRVKIVVEPFAGGPAAARAQEQLEALMRQQEGLEVLPLVESAGAGAGTDAATEQRGPATTATVTPTPTVTPTATLTPAPPLTLTPTLTPTRTPAAGVVDGGAGEDAGAGPLGLEGLLGMAVPLPDGGADGGVVRGDGSVPATIVAPPITAEQPGQTPVPPTTPAVPHRRRGKNRRKTNEGDTRPRVKDKAGATRKTKRGGGRHAAEAAAQSQAPVERVEAMARRRGASLIVAGALVHPHGNWVLIVAVRNVRESADAPVQPPVVFKYPLASSTVPPEVQQRVVEDLAAVAPQLAPPPPMPVAIAAPDDGGAEEPVDPGPVEAPPPPPPGEPVAQSEDKENPLNYQPPAPPPEPAEWQSRPHRGPIADGSIGLLFGGRRFAFDEPHTPAYSSTMTAGITLDANLYPLELVKRSSRALDALRGLGVGVRFDQWFWRSSIPDPCFNTDPSGGCADRYDTQQYRVQAGLRWHTNGRDLRNRPEAIVRLEYGQHQFAVSKTHNAAGDLVDAGPPDVAYRFLVAGLGGRFPIGERLALTAEFMFLVLGDAAPLQSFQGYGTGGGYGLRGTANVDVRLWRGLYARAAGYYEHFQLVFDDRAPGSALPHNPPCPCQTTGGAADDYYGFSLGVGYAY